MELTVYIETENKYQVNDIKVAIEKALTRTEDINDNQKQIIDDILWNGIVVDEDNTH